MDIIQIKEQLPQGTILTLDEANKLSVYLMDGEERQFYSQAEKNENTFCLSLSRTGDTVSASSSYFVGLDWISEGNIAIQVVPKMNSGREINYIKMLNDALSEPDNYAHLKDLVTIRFDKPSITLSNKRDDLSLFLIVEYINILHKISSKGLKKNFYQIEDNLRNKVKGRILIGSNIRRNLMRGNITDNVCKYQVYDVNTSENKLLKKALLFCVKQLEAFKNSFNTDSLKQKVRGIKPYFQNVDDDININEIQNIKTNPIYADYSSAIELAQLILRRYSYNITNVGKTESSTPPFWINMSKLFELYVYHHLRKVFYAKGEVKYHPHFHYQELDYLLNPKNWKEPYVIDAKYKPRYSASGIQKEDARQIAGYSRLSKVYKVLGLDENESPPIKCLIVYPDQNMMDFFDFDRYTEPDFEEFGGYVRLYKVGIKLPTI